MAHPLAPPPSDEQELDPNKGKLNWRWVQWLYTVFEVVGEDSETATTAQLADITDPVNTGPQKHLGHRVFNSTTSIPVYAAGATAASVWTGPDGATDHTPV